MNPSPQYIIGRDGKFVRFTAVETCGFARVSQPQEATTFHHLDEAIGAARVFAREGHEPTFEEYPTAKAAPAPAPEADTGAAAPSESKEEAKAPEKGRIPALS